MYGRVRCAGQGCARERGRSDWTCPRCGYVKTFVDISHQGRRVRLKDSDGRLFTNVEKAHDRLAEVRLAYNASGDRFSLHDFTEAGRRERLFGRQAQAWLSQKEEEAEAGELSWETLKDYRGYVERHFRPLDGLDVRLIDYALLENFKDALGRKLRIKTRRNILNALRGVFRRMHRLGAIREMPPFPVIEGDDSESRAALTYEEQADGLMRIPGREDRAAIEFGFEMLLRPGELCALQAGDVDQLHRRILIRRTWSGKVLRETTKGKSRLWLPLTRRAWAILAPRLRQRGPAEFIFLNPRTGRAYRPKVLNGIWRAHSGTEVDHYSAGRHSGCTQLIHDGTPHLEAQALMRHADIRSTLNYFHADSDRLRERMEGRGRKNRLKTRKKT